MSTTPIITPPPKKPPAIVAKSTILPQGLAPIGQTLKHYSTWALALLVASPDLYQAAASLGMLADEAMPEAIKWSIRGVAGVGLIARFISQKKP